MAKINMSCIHPGMRSMMSEAERGLRFFGVTFNDDKVYVPDDLSIDRVCHYVDSMVNDFDDGEEEALKHNAYYLACEPSGDDDFYDYCGSYVETIAEVLVFTLELKVNGLRYKALGDYSYMGELKLILNRLVRKELIGDTLGFKLYALSLALTMDLDVQL